MNDDTKQRLAAFAAKVEKNYEAFYGESALRPAESQSGCGAFAVAGGWARRLAKNCGYKIYHLFSATSGYPPQSYLHRQWTLTGRIQNAAARLYHWGLRAPNEKAQPDGCSTNE